MANGKKKNRNPVKILLLIAVTGLIIGAGYNYQNSQTSASEVKQPTPSPTVSPQPALTPPPLPPVLRTPPPAPTVPPTPQVTAASTPVATVTEVSPPVATQQPSNYPSVTSTSGQATPAQTITQLGVGSGAGARDTSGQTGTQPAGTGTLQFIGARFTANQADIDQTPCISPGVSNCLGVKPNTVVTYRVTVKAVGASVSGQVMAEVWTDFEWSSDTLKSENFRTISLNKDETYDMDMGTFIAGDTSYWFRSYYFKNVYINGNVVANGDGNVDTRPHVLIVK